MKNSVLKKFSAFALCMLMLSGCGDYTGNEQHINYTVSAENGVINDYDSSYKSETDYSSILSNMEKKLENESLELYFNSEEGFYDIAVKDKRTGEVFLSNPVFYDLDSSAQDKLLNETKNTLFSQVEIEYYDSNQKKFTMSSYKNLIDFSTEEQSDSFTVNYTIGVNNKLVEVFSQETYQKYDEELTRRKGLDKSDPDRISVVTYSNFVNCYTELTYEKMNDSDKKTYLEQYPDIKEAGTIYVIKSSLSNSKVNRLMEVYTMLGIDETVVEEEKEKMGAAAGNKVPAEFTIPVVYKLQGSDFIVSVDTTKMSIADSYYLTKVSLLKTFMSSTSSDEGYIFVPDGSGSIIANSAETRTMDKITIPFYGSDFGKNYSDTSLLDIESSLPVFGIKSNNTSIFAIVEKGASIGGVMAQTESSYMNYNMVYPYFATHTVDSFNREGVALAFSLIEPEVDYTIRYHFLYGKDANYSAMANYYQQYLVNTGVLTRQASSENLPLDVNLIGSITKTVNNFGIPIETSYPVTTFEQAEEIMNIFKDNGISNADLVYSGTLNGGVDYKSIKKVKVESKLGGLNGIKTLNKNLASIGYGLYPEVDFTQIYEKGNGVSSNDDVVKYLSKSSAVMASYSAASASKNRQGAISYLVNPTLFNEIVSSFVNQFAQTEVKDLYVGSVGTMVNSNFSEQTGITRETSLYYVLEALDIMENNGYNMKFDVGNDYVLKYADSLTNVRTSSSNSRIEDYSIPFVGMVLKGYIPYTSTAVNKSGNFQKSILEAVESGAGLSYLLMYANQLELVDTEYTDLFSINYKFWIEDAISQYKALNEDLGYLADKTIVSHEKLTKDVSCVTYEDGSKVYVNYGEADYKVDSKNTVEAMNYLVSK